jgi:hypothetical protein
MQTDCAERLRPRDIRGIKHSHNDNSGRPTGPVYGRSMSPMPQPGDPYGNAFVCEPMQCCKVIHDRQGQATHCRETPTWTGRWFAPSGKRWWRVWACERHPEGLTGLKQFGGPR